AMSGPRRLIHELRRRRVFRVAVVYAAVAFVIWQAADIGFPALSLPDWSLTLVVVLTLLGFPIALVLAWAFEITPEGVKRTEPLVEGVARPEPGGRAMAAAGVVAVFVLAIAAAWLAIRDSGSIPSVGRRSIAVLPFVNNSPDPDDEYFSDGLTEELINALAQVEGLQVPGRTSAFAFKGQAIDPRIIGDSLGVETLLEGSVVKSGDRLRVMAQLINVADGYNLWSESYDRQLSDVFAIYDDLTRAIVGALRVELGAGEEARLVSGRTENLEAYEHYLRGRYFWNQRTEAGFRTAIGYFEEAVAEDRGYAPAYSGMADAYNLLGLYYMLPPREAIPKAREAALEALEIDHTLAEARTSLAFLKSWYDWDRSGAEAEFQRALELNPNYATAHQWYAIHLYAVGRLDVALREARRAVELDPLSPAINTDLGRVLLYSRRYDEAIEQFRQTLELDPDFSYAVWELAHAYVHKGMYEDAFPEWEKLLTLCGASPEELEAVRQAYAESGWRAVVELDIESSKEEGLDPADIAREYALLGRHDEAFEWLERAYEERSFGLNLLRIDPCFDGLRGDPRYTALLSRVGLED
ncbi:MAG: tetratricopeptide repeat protein, partial [Gemmatimonadota bacterium]